MRMEVKIFRRTGNEIDVIKLVAIHLSSDPESGWAHLGEEFTSTMLYKKIFCTSDFYLFEAVYDTEVIGFALLSRKPSRKFSKRLINKRIFISTIKRIFSLNYGIVSRLVFFFFYDYLLKKEMEIENFEINSLMVLPEYQSLGIGSRLLSAIHDSGLFNSIFVITNGKRSRNFYLKNGYRVRRQSNFRELSISLLRLNL